MRISLAAVGRAGSARPRADRLLAQVTGEMTGCTTVSVVIHGKQMPALWHGDQMDQQVLKLAGIRWAGF